MLFGAFVLSTMDKICLGIIVVGGAIAMSMEHHNKNRKVNIEQETLKFLKNKNKED